MNAVILVPGIDQLANDMGLVAKPVAATLPDTRDLGALLDAITPAMFTPGPIAWATEPLPQDGAYLTTEHAASSYGLPVLVKRGQAFGPGDIAPLALTLTRRQDAAHGDAARGAGFTVVVIPDGTDGA